jgi:DNA-binding PadR family transcriptional regulator
MNDSCSVDSWSQTVSGAKAKEPRMSDPSQVLPLTTLTYQILLGLADADRHGYGIIKDIEERTGRAMQIETGAAYYAIRRMQEDGLIEPVPARERPPAEDRRRRTYRITAWGREVLVAETARLRQLVDIAEAKRVLPARAT